MEKRERNKVMEERKRGRERKKESNKAMNVREKDEKDRNK